MSTRKKPIATKPAAAPERSQHAIDRSREVRMRKHIAVLIEDALEQVEADFSDKLSATENLIDDIEASMTWWRWYIRALLLDARDGGDRHTFGPHHPKAGIEAIIPQIQRKESA